MTSTGAFSGTQSQIFNVGTGTFDVKFTSGVITWTVKTYQASTLTASTITASSASNRCVLNVVRMIDPLGNESSVVVDYLVYPNPVLDQVTILSPIELSDKNVLITDVLGKTYTISGNYSLSDQGMTIDLSMLKTGIYFIRIVSGEDVKTFNIMKN